MRFESDILILAIVSGFFVISITIFQTAQRTRWCIRRGIPHPIGSYAARFSDFLQRPTLLPRLSYLAIAAGVGVYAVLIVLEAASIASDFKALIIALLAVIVGFLAVLRIAPLSIVEKAAVYVTATVLVYLDSVVLQGSHVTEMVGWAAVSVAALATALRLRLYNDRTFQVTPLDLIVLFMALVVPSLPGTFNLPHGSALAIAKLVVLFYSLEMLVSRSEHRALWVRLSAALVLAGLVLRPFVPF
jgi:UDP-GlcNAc:undecaprenyl-phosphate GlcNAc-1-phosphate transferase